MSDTLSDICAKKREHVRRQKSIVSEQALFDAVTRVSPPRGFEKTLRSRVEQNAFGLIAEIKKASPSKGVIRSDFDPVALAHTYEAGGASCLSMLTDEPYFQGKDEYLVQVREAVSLPVLRKDFMLDPYQIVEARALGADCVLLIMAALSDSQAVELEHAAMAQGMDVLVEVHDAEELERALTHLKSRMIGINNRNLKTLEVNLKTSESLSALLPAGILGVCESGITTYEDLQRMKAFGLSCFLVGESLMRQPDVLLATKRLLGGEA